MNDETRQIIIIARTQQHRRQPSCSGRGGGKVWGLWNAARMRIVVRVGTAAACAQPRCCDAAKTRILLLDVTENRKSIG